MAYFPPGNIQFLSPPYIGPAYGGMGLGVNTPPMQLYRTAVPSGALYGLPSAAVFDLGQPQLYLTPQPVQTYNTQTVYNYNPVPLQQVYIPVQTTTTYIVNNTVPVQQNTGEEIMVTEILPSGAVWKTPLRLLINKK